MLGLKIKIMTWWQLVIILWIIELYGFYSNWSTLSYLPTQSRWELMVFTGLHNCQILHLNSVPVVYFSIKHAEKASQLELWTYTIDFACSIVNTLPRIVDAWLWYKELNWCTYFSFADFWRSFARHYTHHISWYCVCECLLNGFSATLHLLFNFNFLFCVS